MKSRTRMLAIALTLSVGALSAASAWAARPDGLSHPAHRLSLPLPRPAGFPLAARAYANPPTTAQCRTQQHVVCYSPLQLQTAYDMEPLFNAALNGRGTTIAIVDAFGSPTIAHDLAHFDADFSLPPPPSFRVITPAGKIPAYDPNAGSMQGWAFETSMDVEYAHAMAPGANILLVETPVDETLGTAGFPEIVHAENYVINHKLANVISQSFGAAEQTFPSKQSILDLRSANKNAAAHNVTVLAAPGDLGPTDWSDLNGDYFLHPVTEWPVGDPLVTAVGGTTLHLDSAGSRTAMDTAWNDYPNGRGIAAGSGGLSSVFARPAYQNSVRRVTGNHRGVPDISLSADFNAGALVYTSFAGSWAAGYHINGGTSLSTPLFAGIVAVADQANGSPLGLLNPRLYKLGSGSPGLPDITKGNTTVTFNQNGRQYTVKGYAAVKGYDLATGLGTVDAAKLVAALTGNHVEGVRRASGRDQQ